MCFGFPVRSLLHSVPGKSGQHLSDELVYVCVCVRVFFRGIISQRLSGPELVLHGMVGRSPSHNEFDGDAQQWARHLGVRFHRCAVRSHSLATSAVGEADSTTHNHVPPLIRKRLSVRMKRIGEDQATSNLICKYLWQVITVSPDSFMGKDRHFLRTIRIVRLV